MNNEIENDIRYILSCWNSNIESYNDDSYFDINKMSEDIVKDLLNTLNMGNFINCNDIEKNYKGIDLIDKEKDLGIQVTSDQTSKKIKDTLRKSKDKVTEVKMFFLSTNLPRYHKETFRDYPDFNKDEDILYLNDIIKIMKQKDLKIEVFNVLTKYFKIIKIKDEIVDLYRNNKDNRTVEIVSKSKYRKSENFDGYGISKDIIKKFDNIDGYLYSSLFGNNKTIISHNNAEKCMIKLMDWINGKISFPLNELKMMYSTFDNSSLNIDKNILQSRRNALFAFFSNDIEKSKNIYNRLFNKLDTINEKWIIDDILIDGRNIIYQTNTVFYKNKFQDEIEKQGYNIQYPTIDRIKTDLLNKTIAKSVQYKYKSRYTEIYGIGLEEIFSDIQKIIYNAILYGSITQINTIRGTISNVLILYADAILDDKIYALALKYYILSGQYKEFKNIANKISLNNRLIESKEYVQEILKLRKSIDENKIDYFDIFIFDYYGRLLNDKEFLDLEERMLIILKSNHKSKIYDALKSIPNNIVRLNNINDFLIEFKELVEKGFEREIQNVLDYLNYDELSKENKKLLKEIVSIIISKSDYISFTDLLFNIKKIDGIDDYDSILYKNGNKLLYSLKEKEECTEEELELVIDEITRRHNETINTGVVTGYATEYNIISDYFEKDSKKIREIIENKIFPLAYKSLSNERITYEEKIKLLRTLMYIYYFDNNYFKEINKILKTLNLESESFVFGGGKNKDYLKIYLMFFNYLSNNISLSTLLKKYNLLLNNSYLFEEISFIIKEIFKKEKIDNCSLNILSIITSNMLNSEYEENRIHAIKLSHILYDNGLFEDILDNLNNISQNAKYSMMREIVILLRKLPNNDINIIKLRNNIINNDNYNIRYMGNKYLQ